MEAYIQRDCTNQTRWDWAYVRPVVHVQSPDTDGLTANRGGADMSIKVHNDTCMRAGNAECRVQSVDLELISLATSIGNEDCNTMRDTMSDNAEQCSAARCSAVQHGSKCRRSPANCQLPPS